jgi:hypothetical protein
MLWLDHVGGLNCLLRPLPKPRYLHIPGLPSLALTHTVIDLTIAGRTLSYSGA